MKYFPLLLALLALSFSCQHKGKRIREEQAMSELEQSSQDVQNSFRMTEEGLEVDMESVEKHRKNLEAAGNAIGGKKGEAMKILAEIQGEINALGAKQEAAIPDFRKAIDWAALAKSKDYEGSRKILRDYITINEQIRDSCDSFESTLEKRLDQIGFTGKDRSDFDSEIKRGFPAVKKLVMIIRDCDIEISRISIAMVDRLEKLGDAWQWNTDQQMLHFESDAEVEWFNEQLTQFQKKGALQMETQQQLMERLKGL